MLDGNEKTRQLGMNHSTARARLVKSIMFDMMKRLDEDKCFKCGVRIDDIDHLSIEHKVPWLHNSPELFWDLDNIAFSHLACNKPHRNVTNGPLIAEIKSKCGIGFGWCSDCQKCLPASEFSIDNRKLRKTFWLCRKCRSVRRNKPA
jgi:hypothetical protein